MPPDIHLIDPAYTHLKRIVTDPGGFGYAPDVALEAYGFDSTLGVDGVIARFGVGKGRSGVDPALLVRMIGATSPSLHIRDGETTPAGDFTGMFNSTEWLRVPAGSKIPTFAQGAIMRAPVGLPSYSLSQLTALAASAGMQAYCSDCREPSQGAGAGTGITVFRNASGWRSTAGGAAAN